jgi:hypothetical protein
VVAVVVSQFNLSLPQTLEDFSQQVLTQYSQKLSINSHMNGKGDKRRPRKVPEKEYESNWDRIFNPKRKKK